MPSDPGLAPDQPMPGEQTPAPDAPEIDPSDSPDEMPQPDLPGDDGIGRPMDVSPPSL